MTTANNWYYIIMNHLNALLVALITSFRDICCVPVSPPLPPPPGSVTDGAMAFNMEYNGVDYGTDYSRMSYSGRASQMQPPQTDWVPSNYIEKGEQK